MISLKGRKIGIQFLSHNFLISLSSFNSLLVSLKFTDGIISSLFLRKKKRARGQFFFNWISRIRREMSENKMRKWIANAILKKWFSGQSGTALPPDSNRFRINNLEPCGFATCTCFLLLESNRLRKFADNKSTWSSIFPHLPYRETCIQNEDWELV